MPSVPHQPTQTSAPNTKPPNPNNITDTQAHITTQDVSYQPAPAVLDTASHTSTHVLPRRFLGPIPENVSNSTEVQEKEQRFRHLRREAIDRIRSVENGYNRRESAGGLGIDRRKGVGRVVNRIKVIRRGRSGEEIEEDLDLGSDDVGNEGMDEDEHSSKNKKKKKRKDVWTGESFSIGQEFLSVARSRQSSRDSHAGPSSAGGGGGQGDARSQSSSPTAPQRPAFTARSTQETFVTARTQFTGSSSVQSTFDFDELQEAEAGDTVPRLSSDSNSLIRPEKLRNSQSSSLQPLLGAGVGDDDQDDSSQISPLEQAKDKIRDLKDARTTSPSGLKRLKSAIRKPNKHSTTSTLPGGSTSMLNGRRKSVRENGNGQKSKSVQFPMEPAHYIGLNGVEEDIPTKGNKAPADPDEVLAREGEDAAGTSAGAVEAAMDDGEDEDDGDEEDVIIPGEVVMRDRMLVRVGYHRDDGIALFDEASQRRSPCARMEHMEEYIVVWRKGRVELYQDWGNPFREHMTGYKRLCFIIPLSPSRTSLCIFNETDMTLSLTTSAGKLKEFDEHTRGNTTRTRAFKDRVQQSKQAKWLRSGRKGSHVFILKVAERSRALDWYWELWRELGGELPARIDVSVPTLSTSVRLEIPEDDDQVGGRNIARQLSAKKVVETCWSLMSETVDVHDLLVQRQRARAMDQLDLELAWKAPDGNLEWIAHASTVTGKNRDWAVLAGLAKLSVERHPRTLQLRPAHHQPRSIKLEDGTVLEEPPGVEGYLTRHKSASTPKERVFVSTHDGNIFTSPMNQAIPPVKAGKEGSTPSDLFPEVHHAFLDSEHKRMAKFIERSAGCIDLRNIESVKLCMDDDSDADGLNGPIIGESGKVGQHKLDRSFQVSITTGGSVRFEAHNRQVAKEWVDRMTALLAYWKRRHRVDARLRMDAMALHAHDDPFAGTQLSNNSDDLLSDIWDWCAIKGCRSVCQSGRLFMRKGPTEKFRAKYIVLTGGCLVSFKVKSKAAFYPRKNQYPLFGAYIYSGMLAQDELRETVREEALHVEAKARVYQDGLQSTDGAEDTTFCVRLGLPNSMWGKRRTNPWDLEPESPFLPPPLSKAPPKLLIFRARSKLERDRWVWAINAEMERQVRAHVPQEESLRQYGKVPER